MTSHYPLEEMGGGLGARLSPGPWLVATARPKSLGLCEAITGHAVHPVESKGSTRLLRQLHQRTSQRFVGVLGADVLRHYAITLRIPKGGMEFSLVTPDDVSGSALPLSTTVEGIPVMDVRIEGLGVLKMAFDTTMKGALLATDDTFHNRHMAEVRVGHLLRRPLVAQTAMVEVAIGEHHARVEAAWGPAVTRLCRRHKVDGILGWGAFDGRKVRLDARNHVFGIQKN